MHLTIVGAGTLGRIYGLRLAAVGEAVSFLVRPERAADTSPLVAEQVNGAHVRDALERPDRVTAIPEHTRLVLVAVRFEQLAPAPDPALVEILRGGKGAPVVVLTPMLPKQKRALDEALGRPTFAALPSVSGYIDERGVARYWVIKVTATLIDEPAPNDRGIAQRAVLEELSQRLTRAGIGAHLERDVASLNAATTTTFFPLIAAINAGGGIDGALGDKVLLATALDAAKECIDLGQAIGKAAPGVHLLTRFVGPYLKPGVALGRRLFPEVMHFVDTHFGPKLYAQHIAMGEAILRLGEERGHAMPALRQLLDRVRQAPPSPSSPTPAAP
jgi:ketopantoate reductase